MGSLFCSSIYALLWTRSRCPIQCAVPNRCSALVSQCRCPTFLPRVCKNWPQLRYWNRTARWWWQNIAGRGRSFQAQLLWLLGGDTIFSFLSIFTPMSIMLPGSSARSSLKESAAKWCENCWMRRILHRPRVQQSNILQENSRNRTTSRKCRLGVLTEIATTLHCSFALPVW